MSSLFEKVFLHCEPLRDHLFENLTLFDFISLLRTSWTVYESFQRTAPLLTLKKELRLFEMYVERGLCSNKTKWCEVAAYIRAALDQKKDFKLKLKLRNSSNLCQPFVDISITPWFSVNVKLYERGAFEPSTDSRSRQGANRAITNEPRQVSECIDWLHQALIELSVLCSKGIATEYSDYSLNKFVFMRRLAVIDDVHRNSLEKKKIKKDDLYQQYMSSLGIDVTAHEALMIV